MSSPVLEDASISSAAVQIVSGTAINIWQMKPVRVDFKEHYSAVRPAQESYHTCTQVVYDRPGEYT